MPCLVLNILPQKLQHAVVFQYEAVVATKVSGILQVECLEAVLMLFVRRPLEPAVGP